MNNWFEVGEEVILNCPKAPEYNGEYRIQEIYGAGIIASVCGKVRYNNPTTSYNLGFTFPWLGGECNCFQEKNLRKKHKPSDESFKDMMQNIKSSVRVVEGVA